AAYTFTAADQGAHTFSVTLNDPGTQSLTVTDTAVNSVIGGADVSVAVTATDPGTSTNTSPTGYPAASTTTTATPPLQRGGRHAHRAKHRVQRGRHRHRQHHPRGHQ